MLYFLQLGDFGLARYLPPDQNFWRMDRPGRLPVRYMAPECFTLKRFSQDTDVWAFGVAIWETLTYA